MNNDALRYDEDKLRLDLIPPEQLQVLGEVYRYGAAKYAENNWLKGMAWSRMIGSALRHILAFASGEERDKESGLPHLGHAAWNMLCLYSYCVRKLGVDDRFERIENG